MITFIAFILTILGCINWLLIGLLQYDFIAGLFGFQASIFSRIIYILFGIGAVYLLIRVIVNKGTFKVFERKKKKQKEDAPQEPAKQQTQVSSTQTPANANIEASKEQIVENYRRALEEFDEESGKYPDIHESGNEDGLFDEHFKDK